MGHKQRHQQVLISYSPTRWYA